MGYILLAAAILAEVTATTALKYATGDGAKVVPYLISGVGYIASFVLLSFSLTKGIPLGIAYAIWAGVGVVLVVVISWLLFKETLTIWQMGGIVLVGAGVVLLELGGRH